MAKAGKTAHPEKLSIEQLRAVDCLVAGQTDEETAVVVGRARQTIGLWRSHNPYFQAEINRRRNELWQSSADRLRALAHKSLLILEEALDSEEHGVQVAMGILKRVGIPLGTIGPTNADEIVLAEQKRRSAVEVAGLLPLGPSIASVRAAMLAEAEEDTQ